ncbi:MAG TPA: IgGFc-binding protein [Candidatus Kapabacteria bacterium]|nr:IgGFc-binding protein [Candidatus Kapabacteria bacterium]
MFRSFNIRIFGLILRGGLVLALAALLAPTLSAIHPPVARGQQVLPRAGRSFSFGIIEGPDNLIDSTQGSLSQLTLTVVSLYAGCGVVVSPSGFFLDFNFAPGAATVIDLPYDLMQRFDLGKTNKGILVHTSQPVNLVLHDFAPEAGDATQILPDDALDTNYVAFGWGLYDDPTDPIPERNVMECLVTAGNDSTLVTITPSVNTRDGQSAGVPFTVRLDRGECYIMKADTSGQPSDPSLSGSTIVSTKPVSVISGQTCAYVPVGDESCQELMDELIGKKWWGSHFFFQPLGNVDSTVVAVFTSDRPFFARINNGFAGSTNDRIEAQFYGPAEIKTFDAKGPVRVEAHQLTRGSSLAFDYRTSDPTLVTVLDTQYYTDTVIWNTPYFGQINSFANWVPIICPTADLGLATLDGTPLSALDTLSSVINGSGYSAINPSVYPGEHTIISPDPIFALVTGFAFSDAYSFMAGTAGAPLLPDTLLHQLLLQADSARVCEEFGVSASLVPPIQPDINGKGENAMSLTIPVTYDPVVLKFIRVEPHAVLMNAQYTVDSSTPGTITISIAGVPFLSGSDLFRIVFEGRKRALATTVGNNSGAFGCGDATEIISFVPATFAVESAVDTLRRTFALSNTSAVICTPVAVALTADSILTAEDQFALSNIEITFDTSAQQLVNSTLGGVLAGVKLQTAGQATGDYTVQLTTPTTLTGGDTLLLLEFVPGSSSAATVIHARLTYVRCYDTLTRDLMLSYPISPLYDTAHTMLNVLTSPVSLGDQAVVDVTLSGLPINAQVKQFNLYLTYNHDVLTYQQANLAGTILATWPPPTAYLGISTDTLFFASPADLSTSGVLAHLLFTTYVADSSYSPVVVTSSLLGDSAGCPITYVSPLSSADFLGKDLCGDSVLRSFMHGVRITIDRAEIDGAGVLHVVLHSAIASTVTLTLTDVLGRIVWSAEMQCGVGVVEHEFTLPAGLPSGTLTLRAESGRSVVSKQLMFIK